MLIHVVIVSEQVLANLIPILMEKPDVVYLVISEEMSRRKLDQRLKKLIEKENLRAVIIDQAPDVGLSSIHEFALALIARIQNEHPDAELVLNATGGTKLMSIGFVEFFRGDAQRIIYTDTRHGTIELLPDQNGNVPPSEVMRDVLDVPHYIAAQGLRYTGAMSDQWDTERVTRRKAAAKYLAKHAVKLDRFFGVMNKLASNALDQRSEKLIEPLQRLDYVPHSSIPWVNALRELQKAGVLGWEDGSKDVGFIDAEGARFVCGGWLEEYAFHVIHDEGVFDVRLGVNVAPEQTGKDALDKVKNEFDVLACQRNQLLFVECKTLRFVEGVNDNELAYKLKSLGESARGLFGETWLLSAQPPTPILVERCHQSRIKLMGPTDIANLRESVQLWKRANEFAPTKPSIANSGK